MSLKFSLIVPVYNRPGEVRELFQSLVDQTYKKEYEIVLVEDGSQQTSEEVVTDFKSLLTITYLSKKNTGPGDSRNYGMAKASGNYFLLVDSDCILPPDYLLNIESALNEEYVDCFGGPDTAHPSFTAIQHAINYSMTSIWTTGGIRGHKKMATKFQPRSFNMGLSKQAFEASGGFGHIHPGEDPDLSLRLKKIGFSISYIAKAVLYHKRRVSLRSFYKQVYKFGLARPILNRWHPKSAGITYWFPTIFSIGLLVSLALLFLYVTWPIYIYGFYFLMVFTDAWVRTGKLSVGLLAILAVLVQFIGYGQGFLKSIILVNFSKKKPEQLFPELFFEPTLT
ncbi:MAG: glycosyltransferase [Flavobacteriaceae bacterium]